MDFFLIWIIVMGCSVICMLIYGVTNSIISVITCMLLGAMMMMVFVVIPNINSIDEGVVSHECIPSSTIESMISSNETMQGNVLVEIQMENNINITSLGINAIRIDTYSKSNKIMTPKDVYGFLYLDIYMNETTYFISNFSNGTIHINQATYPDLLPMNLTSNAKMILMYTFSVPEDCPYTFITSYDSDVFQYMTYEQENKSSFFDEFFADESTNLLLYVMLIMTLSFSASTIVYVIYKSRSRSKRIAGYAQRSSQLLQSDAYKRWMASQRQGKSRNVNKPKSKYGNIPEECGDYRLSGTLTTADKSIEQAREFRENGYWVRITNFEKGSASVGSKRCCGVYISSWTKDEQDRGVPKWKK